MAANRKPKLIYTIMPDYGGAYGWIIRDGDESNGVGPNHADSEGWGGDHPISAGLHEAFVQWQSLFEGATLADDETALRFDWESFHAQGIVLCQRLKAELGDAVRIVYEKPFEDPKRAQEDRREILADGSLLRLPGRYEVNRLRLSKLVSRIVSGGQTGADRAALDWAIAHEIPHGGWCSPGRVAEDGVIDARYRLSELLSGGYRKRTRRNVEDSDGTLILNLGELEGGTLQTQRFAERLKKPWLVIQLDDGAIDKMAARAARWLRAHEIKTLNVAGPRESKRPGIHAMVTAFLDNLDQGYEPPGSCSGHGRKESGVQ